MSEEITPIPDDEMDISGEPMTMLETWMKAVTSPSIATYTAIISDPTLSAGKAYGWIALSSGIGVILLFLIIIIIGNPFGITILSFVWAAPLVLVISVIGVTVKTGLLHGIAKLSDGKGTFEKLLYATAAYTSPISIINNSLLFIPVANFIIIPIGLYEIVINVVAIRATHRFGWRNAIYSVVFYIVLLAISTIIFLTIMGPIIGEYLCRNTPVCL